MKTITLTDFETYKKDIMSEVRTIFNSQSKQENMNWIVDLMIQIERLSESKNMVFARKSENVITQLSIFDSAPDLLEMMEKEETKDPLKELAASIDQNLAQVRLDKKQCAAREAALTKELNKIAAQLSSDCFLDVANPFAADEAAETGSEEMNGDAADEDVTASGSEAEKADDKPSRRSHFLSSVPITREITHSSEFPTCMECDHVMDEIIGYEERVEVIFVPAHFEGIRHKYPKVVCPNHCSDENG